MAQVCGELLRIRATYYVCHYLSCSIGLIHCKSSGSFLGRVWHWSVLRDGLLRGPLGYLIDSAIYVASFFSWLAAPLLTLDYLDRFTGFIAFWRCCGLLLWGTAVVWEYRSSREKDRFILRSLKTSIIFWLILVTCLGLTAVVVSSEGLRTLLFMWSTAHRAPRSTSHSIHKHMMGCGDSKPEITRKNANEFSDGNCIFGISSLSWACGDYSRAVCEWS